jgi:hypothetical protein
MDPHPIDRTRKANCDHKSKNFLMGYVRLSGQSCVISTIQEKLVVLFSDSCPSEGISQKQDGVQKHVRDGTQGDPSNSRSHRQSPKVSDMVS